MTIKRVRRAQNGSKCMPQSSREIIYRFEWTTMAKSVDTACENNTKLNAECEPCSAANATHSEICGCENATTNETDCKNANGFSYPKASEDVNCTKINSQCQIKVNADHFINQPTISIRLTDANLIQTSSHLLNIEKHYNARRLEA